MDNTQRIGWCTLVFARAQWPDAPKVDANLAHVLAVAYEMCTGYAPHLAVPDPAPEGYTPPARCVSAQVLHARAVWTAARAKADALGLDDPEAALATVTPTLTGQVKQLLRPPSGVPAVA